MTMEGDSPLLAAWQMVDRGTAAGRALFALYNGDLSGKKAGNKYSDKNRVHIEKRAAAIAHGRLTPLSGENGSLLMQTLIRVWNLHVVSKLGFGAALFSLPIRFPMLRLRVSEWVSNPITDSFQFLLESCKST
jgi:hypothetical protein